MNIPEGWKLVPEKETHQMRSAFREAEKGALLSGHDHIEAFFCGYRAMLAAAPTPPAQPHHKLDDADIKAIALDCGFKFRLQPDGTEDLNPYVYRFAREILSTIPRAEDIDALRQRLTPPAQEDGPVTFKWNTSIREYLEDNLPDSELPLEWDHGYNECKRRVLKMLQQPVNEKFYTHPDGLRKAAEEVVSSLTRWASKPFLPDWLKEKMDTHAKDLRAALEGK